ncbi:hypothetical protein K505DRAFT_359891 [Melanomma pulvis-pyrius CBS 109.77]|uniref:Uncharacterized protein n=1 Tax=Melanomma pulvis-pyrius CBS 109.77 TaxID=1314802 RepID=A0A6A6XHA7_9PLEO|nr:hypothetical protein K505DRAFT_359891 [Melanomma pulvis-pyrius CBS 109.77]
MMSGTSYSAYSRASEKTPLLPVTTINGVPISWPTFRPTPPPPPPSRPIENILLALSLFLSFFHVFILYFSNLTPAFLVPLLLPLVPGLRIAIPAALPTAVAFFLAAPLISTHDRRNFTRCLAVFLYLCGSTLGAAIVGGDLDRQLK